MAVQFRLDASGVAGIGGGVKSGAGDLSHWTPGTPAFYSLVLFAVLLLVIVAVAHSLR